MMARRTTKLVLSAVVLCCVALFDEAPAGSALRTYRIIVHPQNPMEKVDRRFLAQAFLKKVTDWPHGETIHPVDLPPDSMTRRLFVEDVLRRSVGAVKSYWQQRIFSGRGLPPPELDSEEAVISYVLSHPGAVGYVSERADTSAVKILSVE
jgi:ABC-type phosphate transport system substrate-binding protein